MNDDREPEDKPVDASAEDETSATNDDSRSLFAEANEDTLRNAVGAYVLDALPESERAAFESYLARSSDTQDELRQLAPVVALLPKLFEHELTSESESQSPSSDLRTAIVEAARTGQVAPAEAQSAQTGESESDDLPVAEPAKIIRTAPEPSGPLGPARAQGRIRGGVVSASTARPAPTPISIASRLPAEWLAAAALLVIAVGAIFWALALQSRIDSKNREIAAQSSEIAELRQSANASSYTLSAGNPDVAEAGGTLLFSLKDQIGVLYVHDLPRLDGDRVYQLWYLEGEEAPKPGGTFVVDRNGNGTLVVASDTPTYDGIALTEEPEGGSLGPTTAILLQGSLGGVAG